MASSTGASDAMDIGHWVIRGLKINHMSHIININAAGGDISGHQDVNPIGPECIQGRFPGCLTQIPMHRPHGKPSLCQVGGKISGTALCSGKNNGFSPIIGLKNLGTCRLFIQVMRLEYHLISGGMRLRCIHIFRPNMHWLVQELPRQRQHRPRHGRGKQHSLMSMCQCCQQLFDVRKEAQIQHFISLIQHEDSHMIETQYSPLMQVQEPPRGADHDIYTVVKHSPLLVDRAATIYSGYANGGKHGGFGQISADLDR